MAYTIKVKTWNPADEKPGDPARRLLTTFTDRDKADRFAALCRAGGLEYTILDHIIRYTDAEAAWREAARFHGIEA